VQLSEKRSIASRAGIAGARLYEGQRIVHYGESLPKLQIFLAATGVKCMQNTGKTSPLVETRLRLGHLSQ
jgi:hypothetical protein